MLIFLKFSQPTSEVFRGKRLTPRPRNQEARALGFVSKPGGGRECLLKRAYGVSKSEGGRGWSAGAAAAEDLPAVPSLPDRMVLRTESPPQRLLRLDPVLRWCRAIPFSRSGDSLLTSRFPRTSGYETG